jgi:hypothetical protein
MEIFINSSKQRAEPLNEELTGKLISKFISIFSFANFKA